MKEADESQRAAHRSLVYSLFAEVLEYPDEDLHAALTGSEMVSTLAHSVTALNPDLENAELFTRDCNGISLDAIQDEYTRIFDVGTTGRPPCPLMGSSYAGSAKMKSMEEALRFYNHFGLKLNQAQKAMPDQLGTEMEFMHFLAYRQAELLEKGESCDAYRRGEQDFLRRELLFWIPKMNTEMSKITDVDFYRPLCSLLESFLRACAEDQ